MIALLLAVIYLAFISLGLPDSLLGSAWAVMHEDLNAPISYAGVISIIVAAGTILSSLLSDRLTRRFGTWLVTSVSVTLTAAAMFAFSVSNAFWQLCLFAIPYGLGAGAVDAALNHYVALHFSARHMSWLHCFWGVGTIISPYIMGFCLSGDWGWKGGYSIVSVIQIVLAILLFGSFSLWHKKEDDDSPMKEKPLTLFQTLKISGVPFILTAFFCYCAVEQTTMLWLSSYLVHCRAIEAEMAATFASLFFIGITAGRFISGIVAEKVGDRNMIRSGIAVMIVGIILVALPFNNSIPALSGFLLIGLGCAPVYPSIIHSMPVNFGKENSQSIIGIQMASAYLGTVCIPPLFGLIAQYWNIALLPAFLAVFTLFMLVMTELLNAKIRRRGGV